LWLYGYHVHNLLRAARYYSGVRCCVCALLNGQSHANHSFQPYIFVWLYGYVLHNLLRAVVLQQCAAACVHCSTASRAMPNHSFQPCVFDCGCTVIVTINLLRAAVYSSALLRVCVLSKQSHANHSFQLYIFDCSCTVIMYTICCVLRVLQWYSSALLHVHC
jgi:hypothetical protein